MLWLLLLLFVLLFHYALDNLLSQAHCANLLRDQFDVDLSSCFFGCCFIVVVVSLCPHCDLDNLLYEAPCTNQLRDQFDEILHFYLLICIFVLVLF